MSNPFRYFNSSPEVIRLVVMMYVEIPAVAAQCRGSLGGAPRSTSAIETVSLLVEPSWPDVRRRDPQEAGRARVRGYPQWRSHLDEVFVKVNGRLCCSGAASTMEARSWRQWSG